MQQQQIESMTTSMGAEWTVFKESNTVIRGEHQSETCAELQVK
jgi:hypothetical protein